MKRSASNLGATTAVGLRPGRYWTSGDATRLIIAVVVLAVGWILARSGVPGWERRIFHIINGASDRWKPLLWPIMQLGNIVVAAIAALAVGLLLRRWRVAVVAALTPVLAWYAALPVKAWVGRARPSELGLDVVVRGQKATGLGFVSGHATVAWALATMLAPHLKPRLRPVAYALAGLVAIARVYVGAHLPLDVVCGAGLGILVGEVGRFVEVMARSREPLSAPPTPAQQ